MGTPELGFRRSSLAWAVESSWCSLDANGRPDSSGYSADWQAAEIVAFNAWEGIDQPQEERDIARSGPGRYAPDLALPVYSAARDDMLTGEIKVRLKGLRCPATGTDVSDLFFAACKQTVMRCVTRASGDTDTVAVGTRTVNRFPVTTVAEFHVGDLIALTIAGKLEFTRITGISGSQLTVSPALSGAPSASDLIRHVQTYTPIEGVLDFSDNPSLVLRYDQPGRAFEAFGCRMKQYTIEINEKGIAIPTVTLVSPWVKTATSPAPKRLGTQGPYAQRGQSYDLYSSLAAVLAPADAGRTLMQVRSWSLTCDFELTPIGTGDNPTGLSDWMVSNFAASLQMTASPDGTLEAARSALPPQQFHVLAGLGPTQTGITGKGMGYAVCLPGAYLASYAKPTSSAAETTVQLNWADGDYDKDSGSWANDTAVDASFCDGWVA